MCAMTAFRLLTSALLTAAFALGASPAFADAPSTWDSGPSRSLLENVVFFGGWFAVLYVCITLFALVTARNNFVPEPPEPTREIDTHGHH